MDLNEAIYQRRSCRRYLDREVGAPAIHFLLKAAVQAPSALNQQPWVFAVFHGRDLLRDYSERAKRHLMATFPTSMDVHLRTEEFYARPDYDIFHGAGTLIVIYAALGKLNPAEDCCLAAQNLMLAAHAAGLGTCPIGFARPWLDLPETKRDLGVPESYTAVFPVVVGYPDGEPEPVERRDPEIVSWKWHEARALAGEPLRAES